MGCSVYQEALQACTTVKDFLRFGISMARKKNLYFGHGTDNSWDDIWMLVSGVLSLPHDVNSIVLDAKLIESEKKLLIKNLEKRIEKKIPVPYLTNQAYFCDLEFYIDERALIPRSPIAELIQQQFSPWVEAENVAAILDLCTGSACIAIACCYAFPWAVVDAADIAVEALNVARINQKRHDLVDKLNIMHSDCFVNLQNRKYDIIVSNPPYVGAQEMQTLPQEYLHEPNVALACADDGLQIVNNILENALLHLNPGGILVVEVGNTADKLIATYPNYPFTWLDFANCGQGVFLLTYEDLQSL